MGACENCHRKKILELTCTMCKCHFCPGCIQLELHDCKNISDKIQKDLEILSSKNVRVESKKI